MNIFKKIKNSIYNKEYYNSVVMFESLSDGIRFLSKLSILMGLIVGIFFAASLPFAFKNIKSGLSDVVSVYPENLTISIKNGEASINQPEPLSIPIPESFKNSKDNTQSQFNNLMVINTSEPFSLESFRTSSAISFLSKNEIVMLSSEGEIKIMSLSKFGNVEITKDWIQNKSDKANKFLPLVWIVIALLGFVFISIFMFVGGLFTVLFYALIVWGILGLKGIKVDYKRAYIIAIHASTVSLILGMIGNIHKYPFGFVLKILALLIVVYFSFDNLSKLEPKKEELVELKEEDNK